MNVVSITEAITPTPSPKSQQTPHLRTKSLPITQGLFLQHFWLFISLSNEEWLPGCVLEGTARGALLHLLQQKHGGGWWSFCPVSQNLSALHMWTCAICTMGKHHFSCKFPVVPWTYLYPCNILYRFNTEHVYKAYFFFHYCLHNILSTQCITNPQTSL